MTKLIAIFLIVVVSGSCSNRERQSGKNSNNDTTAGIASNTNTDSPAPEPYYKFRGNSVVILPFEIAISLTPAAEQKIRNDKETIIVDVFFTGTPKDSARAKFEEDGSFYVTSGKKEINYGETATFDSIMFSREIYDQLAEKDIDLGVNVYTGRRSSENNLIDCETLFDKISNVVNKKFTLKGKLIFGDR